MLRVSTATISKALNNKGHISPEMRKKILRLTKKLHYHPSPLAQGLVSNRTYTLGMIVPSLTNDFCAQLFHGAEAYANSRNYSIILSVSEDKPKREGFIVERMTSRLRTDGIMALHVQYHGKAAVFKRLREQGIPFVLIGRYFPELNTDYVVCDDARAGYLATRHLLQLGHRKIAFIYDALQEKCTNVIQRRIGYESALKGAGFKADPKLICPYLWQEDFERQVAMKGLIADSKPTAIFAHNDRIAQFILEYLKYLKIRVPNEMALIGFGDFNIANIMSPKLTTVSYSKVEMGRTATKLLIDRIEGMAAGIQHVILEPKLVARESCGAYGRPRKRARTA